MKLNKSNILAALLSYLVLGNCAVEAAEFPTCTEDNGGKKSDRDTMARLNYRYMSVISNLLDRGDTINLVKCCKEYKIFLRNLTAKLDNYSMLIVCKYLDTTDDYVNIEKCCKEYNGIIEGFKYNPISFKNEKERALFKNIETYNVYDEPGIGDFWDKDESEFHKAIKNDKRIKKFIHWEEHDYSSYKRYKDNKHIFKNIVVHASEKKYFNDAKTVEFEEGIRYLGGLSDSQFSKITIPSSVTFIRGYCFSDCKELREIDTGSGIFSLPDGCFSGCKQLSRITISSSVTFIGRRCFSNCSNLSTIDIPSSVTFIGSECFWGCSSLSTIDIPSSVTSSEDIIGDDCFKLWDNPTRIAIEEAPNGQNQALISQMRKKHPYKINTYKAPTKITVIEMK